MRADRFCCGGFVRRGKPVLTSLPIMMRSCGFWFGSEPSILERDVDLVGDVEDEKDMMSRKASEQLGGIDGFRDLSRFGHGTFLLSIPPLPSKA